LLFGNIVSTGHAYFLTDQYAKAIAQYKRALKPNLVFLPANAELAAIYGILGRDEEVRSEAREVLLLSPNFSLEARRQRFPYKDQALIERNIDVTPARKD